MPLENPTRFPALELMQPGDHYCGLFRSDAEHERIATGFVRLGVERNERIIYIVNLTPVQQLKSLLAGAGLEVEALLEKGQLVIRTAREVYLQDGVFDPKRMIDALTAETRRALEAGYSALRVTGEMTWALAGEPGSERLMEYEALLNQFYIENPKCYAICQYDQRRFDAQLLVDVLNTHPKVLVGTDGFDNSKMYFVSPDAYLGADRHGAILDTWLANLAARSAARAG